MIIANVILTLTVALLMAKALNAPDWATFGVAIIVWCEMGTRDLVKKEARS